MTNRPPVRFPLALTVVCTAVLVAEAQTPAPTGDEIQISAEKVMIPPKSGRFSRRSWEP